MDIESEEVDIENTKVDIRNKMSWLYEYEVLSLLRLFVDIIKIHILEVKALHSIRFGIILVKV